MSKRPSSSEKGSEPSDKKINKVEIPKTPCTNENGSELPEKVKNIEKQKNPKKCSFLCGFYTTDLCPDCRKRKLDPLKNSCPIRECSESYCDEEFHLHCYPNYVRGYTDQIGNLNCLLDY